MLNSLNKAIVRIRDQSTVDFDVFDKGSVRFSTNLRNFPGAV